MPSGDLTLDCGNQQTFVCSVTGLAAGWTIRGLSDIAIINNNGLAASSLNSRITTNDKSNVTQSSTITITGFNTTDNGGTIQCINLEDGSIRGIATTSIG